MTLSYSSISSVVRVLQRQHLAVGRFLVHSSLVLAHIPCILHHEVLHGVLYPEAHGNRFKKKKKKTRVVGWLVILFGQCLVGSGRVAIPRKLFISTILIL